MLRYLVDTNVLLRTVSKTAARYHAAREGIATLLARGDEIVLAPQVLIEFWSVATRPTEVNGFGWTTEATRDELVALLAQFPLLSETSAVFHEWLRLVTSLKVVGKQVHDARIVAVLKVHEIARLLTFNLSDFERYGVEAVSPDDIVGGARL